MVYFYRFAVTSRIAEIAPGRPPISLGDRGGHTNRPIPLTPCRNFRIHLADILRPRSVASNALGPQVLRFQLGMVLLVIILPILSIGPLDLYLGDLHEMDLRGSFVVPHTTLLRLWTVMASTQLTGWHAHLRCPDQASKLPGSVQTLIGQRSSIWFALAALPAILAILIQAGEPFGMGIPPAFFLSFLGVPAGVLSHFRHRPCPGRSLEMAQTTGRPGKSLPVSLGANPCPTRTRNSDSETAKGKKSLRGW